MILVVGLAGSGKSTQCQMLEATGRYKWLSVGQLLRNKVVDPKHKSVMDNGDVLDDETVLPLVSEYLMIHEEGGGSEIILDGFPRSLTQAKWLVELKEKKHIRVTHVLHIKASPGVTMPRLLKRGRADDLEAVILERFAEYEDVIMPILSYFQSENIPIFEIDGDNTPEAVHEQIITALRA